MTDAQGQFRFPVLGPGYYDLQSELEGFQTVDYPNVVVNVGRNTSIEVRLVPVLGDDTTQ